MNFHTYGNMWIRPFNFQKKTNDPIPQNIQKNLYSFYEDFEKEVKKASPGTQYGNAIQMVGYSSSGEASDWMFGEKGIISLSPELGSNNKQAQTFYCPRDLIFDVIQENYKVVDLFLQKNTFDVTDVQYGIMNDKTLKVELFNSGLTSLLDPEIVFKAESEFISNIVFVNFQNQ